MAHKVTHFEIGCRDCPGAADFYSKMFDWRSDAAGQFDKTDTGLPGHLVSLGHEPHNYTIVYVEVGDVAQAIANAEQLGGKRLLGPVNIPGSTFARIQDSQVNTVGLLKHT